MHRIYQFSRESGENEFLVISDEPRAAVLEEFLEEGFQLDAAYTIEGDDATRLPCDRHLKHSTS